MSQSRRESHCLLRAQAGDREALNEVLRSVQFDLYRHLSRMLRDAAEAEDALQDTLVLIARKLPWLHEPRWFRAWSYRIASRVAMRRMRGRARRPAQLEGPVEDLGEDGSLTSEMAERLPELLDALSPASRSVIVLHFLESRPLAVVAALLGIPLGTVKSRLGYGLERLRRKVRSTRRTS